MKSTFALLIAAATLSGCAMPPINTEALAQQEEKDYVTGSRLPRKDKDGKVITLTREEARREIEELERTGGNLANDGMGRGK